MYKEQVDYEPHFERTYSSIAEFMYSAALSGDNKTLNMLTTMIQELKNLEVDFYSSNEQDNE
jgi:hypothetical protein